MTFYIASYSTVLQQIPTRRLLDISSAPQEAIHHMLLNFDPLSNIEASTSTVLPQIHSNGDIQGNILTFLEFFFQICDVALIVDHLIN